MALDVTDSAGRADQLLAGLLLAPGRRERITHVHRAPARTARPGDWPAWTPPVLVERWGAGGIDRPWAHQVAAAEHAHAGRSVVLATGTASGKSLAYLLPALTAVLDAADGPATACPGVLYLSPTKALAADQLANLTRLQLGPALRPACFDGDTPYAERDWIRSHANYLLTNPDMLHRTLLPGHARWARFLKNLSVVVVDECHTYRGVFGSHVAQVLRRLRRVCARYGSSPVFVLTSATVSDPAGSAGRLTGLPVAEVTDDASPRGEAAFVLWEPPLTDHTGEGSAPVRRTAIAETADLLTDLVLNDAQTVAFVRSRRGAEVVALLARDGLAEVDPALAGQVASYRGGYLPEERRALEHRLRAGLLRGLAATNALELGIDVAGLDAVVLAGYPGTRASMWQQAGRAGRAGQGALAVLVARDDPLDTYLVHHPEALFGRPVEATVLDPDNPYVLAPHLCAAASESPLTERDLDLFGPTAELLLPTLEERGLLRRRPAGWFWTRRDPASALADIRGTGGAQIRVCEVDTGRLLGTVDGAASHTQAHTGAVYLHQGRQYLVRSLDLAECVALVEPAEPDYSTSAREVTDIAIVDTVHRRSWGDAVEVCFGTVEVTNQVVSYLRKRLVTGEVLDETPLDLPPRHLRTRAVWWTVTPDAVAEAAVEIADLPGAAHAAEHASIGLMPLFATCDRWDIGGVSTALHPDTMLPTVFVYDGHPGGAGFAERGFAAAEQWLSATRDAIASCECATGCPSCVQSPKCGNGNNPLDKAGAVRLLDRVLTEADGIETAGAAEDTETADGVEFAAAG
ncbi:DEAD/DEAH box helicase [Sporichthya polymorpha]|uniref:DEAD/DEAH box helicase n=1 Tax=Sporichthya polymorpha TaxID=35751 RepID=UPI000378AD07|nr:DEAD/DEAH box helicase [Sporichthya polymorpha]